MTRVRVRVCGSDLGALSLLQHLLKLLVVLVIGLGPRLARRSGHEVGRQLSDGRARSLRRDACLERDLSPLHPPTAAPLLLTHMQASRRTFDMMEKREMLPSIPPSWGQTIWSGYGGSGKSVEPHSYAARVTDAM